LPSKRPRQRFGDIIHNIDAIGRYTAGMTQDQFSAEDLRRDVDLHAADQ
jgi:uncharacterized protein with HEPN domain